MMNKTKYDLIRWVMPINAWTNGKKISQYLNGRITPQGITACLKTMHKKGMGIQMIKKCNGYEFKKEIIKQGEKV